MQRPRNGQSGAVKKITDITSPRVLRRVALVDRYEILTLSAGRKPRVSLLKLFPAFPLLPSKETEWSQWRWDTREAGDPLLCGLSMLLECSTPKNHFGPYVREMAQVCVRLPYSASFSVTHQEG